MSFLTSSPGNGEIWFVRHGQSVSNAGLPTDLPGSSGLTELGRRQAELWAASVGRAPDTVVVSPYIRSQLTAKPLLDRFPEARVLTWPIQEFSCLAPARYKGTRAPERTPLVEAYWRDTDPERRDGPGAETFAELAGRVEAFTAGLKTLEGFSVVVGHGTFLRAAWMALLTGSFPGDSACMGRFAHLRHALPMLNTAVFRLRYNNGSPWVSDMSLTHLPPDLRT